MTSPRTRTASKVSKSPPPLPLAPDHWAAIVLQMGLSPRQALIVEWVLRDQSNKQIARIMNLGEPTIKTYLGRIGIRTGTEGRMQLAMHVLVLSHQVLADGLCPPIGGVQPSGCPPRQSRPR